MNWNSTEFVWLDWTVLAIGVIGVIWAVWHAIVKDRKAQKGEDSSAYLFGKGEPWYVIGMAIFAANIGSEHLVGLAGTGAKSGVGMAHWEMQGWMILILGWLFVPFYQLLINKMGKIITPSTGFAGSCTAGCTAELPFPASATCTPAPTAEPPAFGMLSVGSLSISWAIGGGAYIGRCTPPLRISSFVTDIAVHFRLVICLRQTQHPARQQK